MKKILHAIRKKPAEFRIALSFLLALALTAGIAAIFIVATIDHNNAAREQSQIANQTATAAAPTPFDALVSSVKGEAGDLSNQNSNVAQDDSSNSSDGVQVIDANANNSASSTSNNSSASQMSTTN